jgi:hypothetical protein
MAPFYRLPSLPPHVPVAVQSTPFQEWFGHSTAGAGSALARGRAAVVT